MIDEIFLIIVIKLVFYYTKPNLCTLLQ